MSREIYAELKAIVHDQNGTMYHKKRVIHVEVRGLSKSTILRESSYLQEMSFPNWISCMSQKRKIQDRGVITHVNFYQVLRRPFSINFSPEEIKFILD